MFVMFIDDSFDGFLSRFQVANPEKSITPIRGNDFLLVSFEETLKDATPLTNTFNQL